jgi:hypothetical protein
MPIVRKQAVDALIEEKIQGFQDILSGRLQHIRYKFDENTCHHLLWSICLELLDFLTLDLITFDEFGEHMYRLGEIAKGKPELERHVNDAVQIAAGNSPRIPQ